MSGNCRTGTIDSTSSWRDRLPLTDGPTPWGDWLSTMATAQLTPAGVGVNNVLIATDFSQHSDIALHFGLSLAQLYGARTEIVYVMPTDEFVLAGPEGVPAAKKSSPPRFAGLQVTIGTPSQLR